MFNYKKIKRELFYEWAKLMPAIPESGGRADSLICPSCTSQDMGYIYIGNTDSRIGYSVVWCNHCLQAIHNSRLVIPENVKMYSFDDIQEINDIIPENLTFLQP